MNNSRAWLSGRAFRCQRKGRRFESARPLQNQLKDMYQNLASIFVSFNV